MIETENTYVVKDANTIGIHDDRLVEILRAAEQIRAIGVSRNDIIERIYGFSTTDTKESIMERLAMAYFAGNQTKNPRIIKHFSVHHGRS